ncbi:MAG: CYTH domain-containing protein [Hyphomicrobiaceae bacterium]
MALEIERKFRVVGDGWRAASSERRQIQQAYLTTGGRVSVRVRIIGRDKATLTLKTIAAGISRHEFEYAIPVSDAEQLFAHRDGAIVAKTRHIVQLGQLTWEVDVFEGANAGLVIAEVELASVEQEIQRPAWLGEEVTKDRRFYNADLARHPFSSW